ncbi:LysE family translocator [Xanthobacter agilis]|uniref:Threonine/homoserine/homoserine lactone efflux protein n=1 Tax=Xanthobacter agilis TaxID=47492 RepID=A0ABU0LJ69_XANAG|nr:LysE family translocator [Xanthobacter agilis]MDQ0507174.1 threonine/homoserine/homoserine lactone efflux protein [Xanthobacter agilis]
MEPASLALFAAVLTLGAASPGPAVVALVARTLARGRAGSFAFILGLATGDIAWLAAAALGLAALAAALGSLFVIVRLAGAGYLAYMAYRLWTAPAAAPEATAPPARQSAFGLYGAGLALTLSNPKTMAFYLALLPTLMDLDTLSMVGFGEMSGIILVVLPLVFAAYVQLADRARRFIASRRAMRALNRVCGVALAGAAVSVATK